MRAYELEEEVLDEMPLPATWDASQYGPGTSFKARLAYALQRAQKLGTGSSRVAMTIEYEGRPTVLKVAKNAKGLAQNEAEAEILSDGYASKMGILIPLIDYDEQNRQPSWIHTEIAQKASEKQLSTMMGCNYFGRNMGLWTLVRVAYSISGDHRGISSIDAAASMRRQGADEQTIEKFFEYAHALAELHNSFDVVLGDFSRAANWGLYQGKPVIIDVGFTSSVMQSHYSR